MQIINRRKSGKKAGTKIRTILKKETKEKRVGDQEITGKTDCNRCEIWKTGTEIFGAGYGKEERINAMKLSKYEKETIILTNEEEKYLECLSNTAPKGKILNKLSLLGFEIVLGMIQANFKVSFFFFIY